MGVSFEVARVGTRYKPKLLPIDDKADDTPSANDSQPRSVKIGAEFVDDSNKKHKNVSYSTLEELEASFSLNLFKDGFSIGKGNKLPSDVPKQLLPYDKASETLFSAIEYGWLPGDMLDDIPCKYVNGALMCEIRDYRHILPFKDGHTSTANVPIVHKLTLQLCMEAVVKDILSVSTDSWTYKDLLEIESCIIKALQPDLHLNPEPIGGTLFGEPRRKKLDLGIAWSWKKRKLSDEPMQGLPVRSSNLANHAMHDYLKKCKPRCGPLEKEKSTSSMQENISSCFGNPQRINLALDYSSPPYALTVPKTSNFVDVPNQSLSNANNGMALGNSIVPCENRICNKQSTQGTPYKKPKQEPVDLPKLQLVGSQVSIAPQCPEQLQCVDNALQEQYTVDKILCESKKRKLLFPQSTHGDQMMLKGIQSHQIRAPSVKPEPAETSGLHTDDFCRDSSIGPSNSYNSKQHLLLKPLTVTSASICSSNRMDQSYDKCLKNGNATPKRKNSRNLQATAADGGRSTTRNSYSLQRQASTQAAHKNSRSRGLKAEMADSVISMSSRNLTGANSLTVKNLCPPQQSVEVKNAADRLLKLLKVCERYGLINRKLKLDQVVQKKPSFSQIPPLVGVHLASFEDSGKSEDSVGCKTSSAKYSSYWKTRTLIFSHEYQIIQRSGCPMVDDAALVKLVVLEDPDLGTVEVRVCYGRDGDHPISSFLLPTFPSSLHSVNQFAGQFTSLMIREGYRIISDQAGSLPRNENGELGIKKQPIVSNSNLTYRTLKPSATCTAGLSSPPLQNSSSRIPFQLDIAMQSPQPNILSGVDVTTGGNSLSSPQLTRNISFNLQIDNLQQQMRSIQQWWQQSANKFLWLQYQMQLLKYCQEQELIPRTESTVHLGAADASGHGTVPLNGGRRIIRNIESSSPSHITGFNGSGPIFSEGLLPWLNSLNTSGNLQNNHTSGLIDEQLIGALSDGRFAAYPKPSTSQGHGFIGGLSNLRNASMLSIANTDATNMRNMFNTHSEPWAQISQQLHTVPQQDIRSMAMLGPKNVARFSDQVVSSLPLVPSLHNNLPQLSTQLLNPIRVPTSQQMNHASMPGSGSPEVSAWTHGSVGSSNI